MTKNTRTVTNPTLRPKIATKLIQSQTHSNTHIFRDFAHKAGERKEILVSVKSVCFLCDFSSYKHQTQNSAYDELKNYELKIGKLKADNLLSQALEHEVDHLNGILYTDHLAEHEELYKIEHSDPTEAITEDELDSPSTFKVS